MTNYLRLASAAYMLSNGAFAYSGYEEGNTAKLVTGTGYTAMGFLLGLGQVKLGTKSINMPMIMSTAKLPLACLGAWGAITTFRNLNKTVADRKEHGVYGVKINEVLLPLLSGAIILKAACDFTAHVHNLFGNFGKAIHEFNQDYVLPQNGKFKHFADNSFYTKLLNNPLSRYAKKYGFQVLSKTTIAYGALGALSGTPSDAIYSVIDSRAASAYDHANPRTHKGWQHLFRDIYLQGKSFAHTLIPNKGGRYALASTILGLVILGGYRVYASATEKNKDFSTASIPQPLESKTKAQELLSAQEKGSVLELAPQATLPQSIQKPKYEILSYELGEPWKEEETALKILCDACGVRVGYDKTTKTAENIISNLLAMASLQQDPLEITIYAEDEEEAYFALKFTDSGNQQPSLMRITKEQLQNVHSLSENHTQLQFV